MPAPRQKLTPEQRTFNRLTAEVEKLQAQIQRDTARLDGLLQLYVGKVGGLLEQVAQAKLVLAKAMGASLKAIKYGSRQADHMREAIFTLCDEAFATVVPDEPTQAFFKEWSNRDYMEEVRSQQKVMREDMEDMARAQWGIDIDFSEMGDTPEEMAAFAHRLKARLEGIADAQPPPDRRPRRKSKKQLEREQREQEEQQQQMQTLRQLYLSLAKALHPDTEPDAVKKVQKEDLMRRVTAAYASKDMATLLRLEMEWLAQAKDNLASLSKAKLRVYITFLREQVDELEDQHMRLLFDPRYHRIRDVARMTDASARRELAERERMLRAALAEFAQLATMCEDRKHKPEVAMFAKEYVESAQRQYDFADFMFR